MKRTTPQILTWLAVDLCLVVLLTSGSIAAFLAMPDSWNHAHVLFLWAAALLVLVSRLVYAAYLAVSATQPGGWWRLLVFVLHAGVLCAGIYVVFMVGVFLSGAGVSVGEPAG